jgi:hypothetical protein
MPPPDPISLERALTPVTLVRLMRGVNRQSLCDPKLTVGSSIGFSRRTCAIGASNIGQPAHRLRLRENQVGKPRYLPESA